MNIKMATNSQLPTTESKNRNKLSKQGEQERIIGMEITQRVISWKGEGGEREKRYRDVEA